MRSPVSETNVTGGAAARSKRKANTVTPAASATASRMAKGSLLVNRILGEGAMYRILVFLVCVVSHAAVAANLDRLTHADAASGLKQALTEGSAAAVAKLGVENGYLANPKVKIP